MTNKPEAHQIESVESLNQQIVDNQVPNAQPYPMDELMSAANDAGNTNAPNDPKQSQDGAENQLILDLGKFRLYPYGLYAWIKSKAENSSGSFERVGNYIMPVGKTNLDGVSCLLLEFSDSNDSKIDFMLECGELADTRGLAKRLLNAGYKMDFYYQRQLQTYLNEFNPDTNITPAKQIGWCNGCYVLPDRVIGDNDNIRYYGNLDGTRFASRGTLLQWQESVAKPCTGFDMLEIALYAGFSSMLVPFVNFGYGLHLNGKSSGGKTTALRVASSIFGNPKDYMSKWNSTHNGIEFYGYNSNHALCVMDEINEAAKTTLDSIYMLIDGRGKTRAVSRTSGVEQAKPKTWQTVALSSGEVSIQDMALHFGKNLKAGESVRMLDIEVSHICKDKAHADLLIENSGLFHGTANTAFIEYIQCHKIDVLARFKEACQQLTGQCEGLHSQASRVAQYFALMRVAGDLAIEAGILPSEFKPTYYTTNQFKHWYKDNRNSKEKQQILSALAQAVADPQRFVPNCIETRITPFYIGFYDAFDNWYIVPSMANNRLWKPLQIDTRLAKDVLEREGYMSKPIHQPRQQFNGNTQQKIPRLNKQKVDELANSEAEK